MIKEKIKQINFGKKKVFTVVVIISVALLVGIGGSFALYGSSWIKIIDGKKVVDIEKMEKEFNRQMKEGNVVMLEEVKIETSVRECEETCGVPCNFHYFMSKNPRKDVINVLENAVIQCPENRYYHEKLAYFLWHHYKDEEKNPALLEQAIKEAEIALDMGLGFHLPRLASKLSVELKDVETLDRIFEKVLATEDGKKLFYSAYIKALIKMNDPRIEEISKKALNEEHVDEQLVLLYAEWLLDEGRESEVILLPTINHSNIYFYRGIALERLGRLDEAKSEYVKYKSYKIGSSRLNPERFQIPESELQKEMDIHFRDDKVDE